MKFALPFASRRGWVRLAIFSALAALVLLALAGAFLGPDLIDNYRFDQAIQASARAKEANAGPWPQLSAACTVCHGDRGNSSNQLYPRLAGQSASYLTAQLDAFASGERANPTMSPMASNLSHRQIATLAAYFAAQPAAPNTTLPRDPARRDLGAKLAQADSCASCHGANLHGQAGAPRIAGQSYDYLLKQLQDFKRGARKDRNGVMASIAAPLSNEDMLELAQFIAASH